MQKAGDAIFANHGTMPGRCCFPTVTQVELVEPDARRQGGLRDR